MDATFRFSHLPPTAKLTIDGELDLRSQPQLAWRLRDLESVACDVVRLDVGRVNYIDHDALRLIDETRRRLVARGVEFEVVAASLCFTLVSGLGGYRALASLAERARDAEAVGV
jgi:hypothetical protein